VSSAASAIKLGAVAQAKRERIHALLDWKAPNPQPATLNHPRAGDAVDRDVAAGADVRGAARGKRGPKAKGKETTSGKLRRACPVSVSFYGAGSTTDGKDVRRNHTHRQGDVSPRLSPFRSFGG
jgi:hypothetical protein